MYKALNYWVFGGFDGKKTPYEFIDWAAKKKLDGVELTVGDALKIDITKEECEKIAAYAASKGIGLRTLASGAGWSCALAADDKTERAKALAFVKKYLQIAAWIGAESILVVPGATRVAWDPSRPVMSYKKVWKNATAAIRKLIPLAEKLKVNIALENVWNRFLISPMEWKFFLDQFQSKYVGIYFDAGNASLTGRAQDFPEILGKYIKAVHLKNFEETDCAGGLHNFGDDLFKGVVDFKALFAELDKIGYKGPFTVEMIPFSRLPDLVLPDAALADKMASQIAKL
ncbi:MAG: L-ribulose-5-phosphate 3-epimerase UlaE [Lentisphaerae bacterium ADurb.Bin242]|nr:MAG: L-ribulose-5-phosphate 3-epimerase UlaE [Lentisphaerae bacterium ADurb.Bin242]